MKIPRSVKIGAYRYKIKWVNSLIVDEDDCYGNCDANECIIFLRKDIKNNPVRLQEVFLHECLHAIEHSYGMDLPETTINQLGLGLINLILDNKIEFSFVRRNSVKKKAVHKRK